MALAVVHASPHPLAATRDAFARVWPEAAVSNIMDDGLFADLARDGGITPATTGRFVDLTAYAVRAGAGAVLFTCSAFGPCIEAAAAAHPAIPVLKPNEAMIEEAAACGGAIGLLATFEPTIRSMLPEFPPHLTVEPHTAHDARAAFERGDLAEHDRLLAAAAARAFAGCAAIALAQFSIARAADAVRRATGRPVFTTPDCAVRKLRRLAARPGLADRRGGGAEAGG